MNITIIGASAGIGLETTRLALQRGHQVTTLSRHLDSLPDHPDLRKVQGSSTAAPCVRDAVHDAHAILVTLGTGTSTMATTLYSDSARVLLEVLRESSVQVPLIVLTGFGAGDSWQYNSPLVRLLFRLFLKDVYADKSEMERLICGGYAHWEIVRPGRLTDAPAGKRYRVLAELGKGMKVGAISRGDVAHFLLEQAESPSQLGRYVALSD